LAAATSLPAGRFHLDGRGRIAPGYRADLLLVRGDPTRDIGAMLAIDRIWKNGFPVSRQIKQ
jgi:imidazolonepropionase-like amidohydrolase